MTKSFKWQHPRPTTEVTTSDKKTALDFWKRSFALRQEIFYGVYEKFSARVIINEIFYRGVFWHENNFDGRQAYR